MPEVAMVTAWVIVAFFVGALPFSVWIGKLFLRSDIRTVGDGNPGATTAWKAGGWRLGLLVLLLDFLKGAIPVGFAALSWGWSGAAMVAVALAPIIGHDFSPFLRGHGGKGLATTFGIWTGLLPAIAPLVLGGCMVLFTLLHVRDGWTVIGSQLALLAALMLLGPHPAYLLTIWLGSTALLIWKYRNHFQLPLRVVKPAHE
jgi:glycerol-3-phosphate acyltransferase PlsY